MQSLQVKGVSSLPAAVLCCISPWSSQLVGPLMPFLLYYLVYRELINNVQPCTVIT